jgi:hypothetical protein
MDKLRLIPTIHKEKPGGALSYPIGAEAVSRALADVPEFESLRLYCGAKRTRQLQPYENAETPVPILELQYRNSTREGREVFERLGRPALERSVRVVAVPRNVAATVRELLVTQGLDLARKWVEAPRTETWRRESHWMLVRYDPNLDGLSVEEE